MNELKQNNKTELQRTNPLNQEEMRQLLRYCEKICNEFNIVESDGHRIVMISDWLLHSGYGNGKYKMKSLKEIIKAYYFVRSRCPFTISDEQIFTTLKKQYVCHFGCVDALLLQEVLKTVLQEVER